MVDLKNIRKTDFWYVVGYIATDGCLSKDGRHVIITSKDQQILVDILLALNLEKSISLTRKSNGRDQISYMIQIGDVKYYRYLQKIGLSQSKTFSLGKIRVPERYFPDFFRGVVDGDGSISSWTNRSNGHRQWSLRIVSAAKIFADWLKSETENTFKVSGKLHTRAAFSNRKELYIVKFGKVATKIILKQAYSKGCLTLQRKYVQAQECLQSNNGWVKYQSMSICPGAVIGSQTGLKIQRGKPRVGSSPTPGTRKNTLN